MSNNIFQITLTLKSNNKVKLEGSFKEKHCNCTVKCIPHDVVPLCRDTEQYRC